MSDHPIFWVGNRDPSISDVITDEDGAPEDLTGLAVKFKAREVNSDALLVNSNVNNTLDNTGVVRYDWTAADLTTGGILAAPRTCLVWWEVTAGGKTQDVNEAIIEIRAHAPETRAYVELEEFKSSAELTGTRYLDEDARSAIVGASRAVDEITDNFFWLGDPGEVRYYSPRSWNRCHRVRIDPIIDLDALATDPSGGTTFGDTWIENTDFVLEDLNAPAEGKPWRHLRALRTGGYPLGFPYYPRSIKVTGQFGWATVPDAIRSATGIIATQIVKMKREAPFGIVALGVDGTAVRIARSNPVVMGLLAPYGPGVLA